MWQYISDSWIILMPEEGAAGSSVMPNKINPINLENAEGNAMIANWFFEGYCRVLPISRRHTWDYPKY
jgi:adenylosuccinate lyase